MKRGVRRESRVLTENAENLALDTDAGSGSKDGRHLGVGGLEADHTALAIEAFEGSIGAVDQGDDDLAFTSCAGALDQDIVPGDDVFIAHGVAANLKGEDFAVADDVVQRDTLG